MTEANLREQFKSAIHELELIYDEMLADDYFEKVKAGTREFTSVDQTRVCRVQEELYSKLNLQQDDPIMVDLHRMTEKGILVTKKMRRQVGWWNRLIYRVQDYLES